MYISLITECVSNVDDHLGELFLEEKTPTNEDIHVSLKICLRLKNLFSRPVTVTIDPVQANDNYLHEIYFEKSLNA